MCRFKVLGKFTLLASVLLSPSHLFAQTYCSASAVVSSYEYIKQVELTGSIGGFSNDSGSSVGAGYQNFTNIVGKVKQGEQVALKLTPGFTSSTFAENWTIYADYNKNGVFTDAGELIFSGASSTLLSGTILVPTNAAVGTTRLRVMMKWGGFSTSCESFTYGQVEDYTLDIAASTTPPPAGDYCPAKGTYANWEWIAGAQTADLSYPSGATQYSNFTKPVIGLAAKAKLGSSIDLQLVPGFQSGSSYDERWVTWIDFNQDKDFTDPGEMIVDKTILKGTIGNAKATIPSNALVGSTRVRTRLWYGFLQAANSCGDTTYGEVEDYTIELSANMCSVNGFLKQSQVLAPQDYISDSAFGDVNGDGKQDLVVASSYALSLFLGNGTSTLGAKQVLAFPVALRCSSLILANLDNKYGDEIICREGSKRQLNVLNYNGVGGTAQTLHTITTGIPSGNSWGSGKFMAAGDLNNDGYVDIVYADRPDRSSQLQVVALKNESFKSGIVQFSVGTNYVFPTAIYAQRTPVLADFNSDGLLDIAMPNGDYDSSLGKPTSQAVTVLLSSVPFLYSPISQVIANSPAGYPVELFVRDVNKDGKADLVISYTDYLTRKYSLFSWLASGNGFPNAPTLLSANIGSGTTLRYVKLVDLEKDGTDELLTLGWTDKTTNVYRTSPPTPYVFNTTLAPALTMSTFTDLPGNIQSYSDGLSWGDLNGDSGLDFAIFNPLYVSASSQPLMMNINSSVNVCN